MTTKKVKLPPGWAPPVTSEIKREGYDLSEPITVEVTEAVLPPAKFHKRRKGTWEKPPRFDDLNEAPNFNLKSSIRAMLGPNGEGALRTICNIALGIPFSVKYKKGDVEVESPPEVPKLSTQLDAAKFTLLCLHGNPLTLPDDPGSKPPEKLSDDELKRMAAELMAKKARAELGQAVEIAGDPPDEDA